MLNQPFYEIFGVASWYLSKWALDIHTDLQKPYIKHAIEIKELSMASKLMEEYQIESKTYPVLKKEQVRSETMHYLYASNIFNCKLSKLKL